MKFLTFRGKNLFEEITENHQTEILPGTRTNEPTLQLTGLFTRVTDAEVFTDLRAGAVGRPVSSASGTWAASHPRRMCVYWLSWSKT
jgi:hypothetical protein